MKICDKENDLILNDGNWSFNEKVSKVFYNHVRRSIPFYDELHRMVIELSLNFINVNSVICDLGTATGEFIINLDQTFSTKNLKIYAIDNSKPMLDEATKRCERINNINFINSDLATFDIPRSDLIISIFTMQFLNINDRNAVIKKIYKSLNMGGAFIICEKIIFENPSIDSMYIKFHEDFKIRNSFSHEEIIAKKQSLDNVMKPITLAENLKMLYDNGFIKIEQFFQWYNFVGLISIKTQ